MTPRPKIAISQTGVFFALIVLKIENAAISRRTAPTTVQNSIELIVNSGS